MFNAKNVYHCVVAEMKDTYSMIYGVVVGGTFGFRGTTNSLPREHVDGPSRTSFLVISRPSLYPNLIWRKSSLVYGLCHGS